MCSPEQAHGTVYISDAAFGLIREVMPDGLITTIAGAGTDPASIGFAGDGGSALKADFNGVSALAVDSTTDESLSSISRTNGCGS
jgi:hypothetical protein